MTFKHTALFLLLASPLLLAEEDPVPLCQSYTPGLICLCDGWGISFFAEGLYWTTREHHLVYAVSNSNLEATSALPPALGRFNFRGQVQRITPTWDWGWRAGMSYTSSCDYWDAVLFWTNYSTHQKTSLNLVDLPALNVWGYPDLPQAERLFSQRGAWNLNYQLLDAEFGRAFWIGSSLAFRPHFGARFGWIDQTLTLVSEFQPANTIPFGARLHLTSDFSGAGLRSGLDLHFTTGTGPGFYGKISYALLYGSITSSLIANETSQATSQIIADTTDNHKMTISALQTILGINWKRFFCCNRFLFGLYLQGEMNHWNDVGKFLHFQGQLGQGIFHEESSSLSLWGLSFGGHFDF